MKGKLNTKGELLIFRGVAFKAQRCVKFSNAWCSDSCPLFDEAKPEKRVVVKGILDCFIPRLPTITGKTLLRICEREFVFDEFTDDRQATE